MSKSKTTLIFSCFNSADLMKKCFDSLTNQTLKEIEFIFIDGCSNDNIKKIIKFSLISLDPKARLISESNQCLYDVETNILKEH